MKPSEVSVVLSYCIKSGLPVLLTGQPGVGKTDLVTEASAAEQADLLVSHPVVDDPTDYKGLPFAGKDGRAEFLPYGNLARLMSAKKPTVCFLDDLGQASPLVQAAAMQLILAREINGKKISDKVTFIAATNRKQDRAGVSGLLEPLKSRFVTIVKVEPNLRDWVRWARGHKVPEELIMFVQFRPRVLTDFQATADLTNSPSPRTIAHVGKLLKTGLPIDLLPETVAGAAGEGFATEFCGFLANIKDWPDIDEVIANPAAFQPPRELSVQFAVATLLSQRMTKLSANNVGGALQKFSADIQAVAWNGALDRDPSLKNTAAYGKYAMAQAA